MSNGSRSGLKTMLRYFSGARHTRLKGVKEHAERVRAADRPPTANRGAERGL